MGLKPAWGATASILTLATLLVLLPSTLGACKQFSSGSSAAGQKEAQRRLVEGRDALENGQYDDAVRAFQAALLIVPYDVQLYVLMARAQQQSGNDSAAILSLKQAGSMAQAEEPTLKRQIAEVYQKTGQTRKAIQMFSELQGIHQMSDGELINLARLKAQVGQYDSAFQTLETIQLKRPDDPDAKVLESEILLLSGQEVLAAKLMDRLAQQLPSSTPVRLLRARYFLKSGYPVLAEKELKALPEASLKEEDVLDFKARLMNELGRHAEAKESLQQLLKAHSQNPRLLARLAETELLSGNAQQAQAWVEQALALKPQFPWALYVRARALEMQGFEGRAEKEYDEVLKADPDFAPALSRLWRVEEQQGNKGEAMATLERLLLSKQASIPEKVELARLYAENKTNLGRGRKLIEEALRMEPTNPKYLSLQSRFKQVEGPHEPTIIRGPRHSR